MNDKTKMSKTLMFIACKIEEVHHFINIFFNQEIQYTILYS